MRKVIFFIFIFLVSSVLWAQNRHALVIGNASYSEKPLPNAINDTNDISAALNRLGYTVVLKQNLRRLDMIREIDAFMTRLRSNRNSEGFFWYAGHAIVIEGESLLLPLDVNLESKNMVKATSYKVNDMTSGFRGVRNKVNVVVLDACRVPPDIDDDDDRSVGDTSRVLKSIPVADPDLFVIFSTAPNTTASDGTGKRNSPFTEAFLKHIGSTEPLTIMMGHVTSETLSLTGQGQRPYTSGSMGNENIYYSLNPAGVRPPPDPSPNPIPDGFVRINGGTFTMGSPRTEAHRDNDERQHQVTVSSFYMSAKEVTLKEYLEVMQFNPNGLFQGANLPVININWYSAVEYCNARSIAEGLTPAYYIYYRRDPNNHSEVDIDRFMVIWDKNANGYRLPTEAEWEYACRAGTSTAYNTGDRITNSQSHFNGGGRGIDEGIAFPVGAFYPNRWGLYDMHGNVGEWCWDWYGEYDTGTQVDPSGPASGKWRVAKGGSYWNTKPEHLRSAYRLALTPTWYGGMGIRLVRSIISGQQPQQFSTAINANYSLTNAQRKASRTRWQVGAFVYEINAYALRTRLENAGIDTSYFHVERIGIDGRSFYCAFVGENLNGTMRILLYQAGFPDAIRQNR